MKPLKLLSFALAFFFVSPLFAQIYEPDGLRMPGSWNDWTNEQNMGGPFDLLKQTTGTPRWKTTFEYTGNTGEQQFKFASTSFGDVWGNQWAGNTQVPVNQFADFTYGTPSDPDNAVHLQQNKWYTVVFEDNGYENTRAIFMETSHSPVAISSVLQDPVLVEEDQEVTVTAVLSAAPSPEEKFFLRYSTNQWESDAIIPMQLSAAEATAVIPDQASGTTVSFYVFSSVMEQPGSDADLLSLMLNNNSGSNFSYTVDAGFDCGQQAGLATSEPPFPMQDGGVTVYFNAAYGNGGLFNFDGDVYAHTGVITSESTGPTDWKYVKTGWGENTPETKLTRIEPNVYSLSIDNIREYYGLPDGELVLSMAFVFRSAEEQDWGGYLEHKNADGSDIFVDVYELELNVKILSPNRREPLVSPNTVLPVCVEALENESLQLFLNQELLTEENATSLAYPLVLQELEPGKHWIKAVASSSSHTVSDSVQIYLRAPVEVADLPQGVSNGINYINENTVTLVLHDPAAFKQFAFAIGDHSNWQPSDETYMKRTPDGKHYWVTLTGLEPGREYAYQYYIDGNMKIADAWSEKILDPWNDPWIPTATYPNLKPYPFDKATGIVSVFQTNRPAYEWQVSDFVPPAVHETQSDLLIYELLVRDFVETRRISDVEEKLDYLKELGVNAVQLMPIIEFDGNESWGYAPNFFFATDKYYGTRRAYKEFIDAAHQRDMAVILDIVPNHAFGGSPMVQMYFDPTAGEYGQPAPENPWFNPVATHPFSVGYDFNHESPYTRQFFKDVFAYWLTEFNVDGYRIDLSKGLTQNWSGGDMGAWSAYDQSRIDILTDYYNHIKSVNPNAYVILEHFAVNEEETVLANTGMMLWSAMHERYKQIAMGWQDNSDVSWAHHSSRGWNYPNLIDYMENHDEERMMFEALSWGNASGDYDIKDTLTALHHQEQALVTFLGIPGPKMLWQFQEMGYDYSIFYGGDRLAPKPPRWDYLNNPARERLHRVIAGMQALRETDAFRFGSFTHDLGGNGKRMWITHSSMDVVMATNMGAVGFDMSPGFTKTGTWYDYFSGQSLEVSNAGGHSIYFAPGDYRVFTSEPLPKPFHALTVKVVDKDSQNPIGGAKVSLQNAGSRTTDAQGLAGFLAFPQPIAVEVEKNNYLPATATATISGDTQLTVELTYDASSLTEAEGTNRLRFYPNPAGNSLTIEGAKGYIISIYSLDGRLMKSRQLQQTSQNLSLEGLPAGIYLLRYANSQNTGTERFMIK